MAILAAEPGRFFSRSGADYRALPLVIQKTVMGSPDPPNRRLRFSSAVPDSTGGASTQHWSGSPQRNDTKGAARVRPRRPPHRRPGETAMNGREEQGRDYRFLTGLAMGGIVGAGLAMWLAPRAAAEIKARAAESAKSLGDAVSERYRDARIRVTETVDGLSRKGQGLRDDVCDTVVRAAQDVELGAQGVQRYATDAKTLKVV
jgi:gas vesicle protein